MGDLVSGAFVIRWSGQKHYSKVKPSFHSFGFLYIPFLYLSALSILSIAKVQEKSS